MSEELEDSIENCDRSKQSESIDSIPLNPKHSGRDSASGDLPTPPYGHPSVREASACAEEGICMREMMLLGFILQPKLQIFSRPIFND